MTVVERMDNPLAQSNPLVQGIKALASLFPNAVKLTGDQATRDNLMRAAPKARYLHLASHGYFRRDNPMFSFLKLADSNLNFYSLMDLKLKAEMVTLSACHTGVNKVFPGDELHGLMRGFMRAGAPSLVASLWATGDASTAELMKQMYSRISAGVSKRGALRAAQLAVKDEYGHPYYWAPFILMGNPN
jgi:CHAT domain-containing protein